MYVRPTMHRGKPGQAFKTSNNFLLTYLGLLKIETVETI
jgi:hypothetical protein